MRSLIFCLSILLYCCSEQADRKREQTVDSNLEEVLKFQKHATFIDLIEKYNMIPSDSLAFVDSLYTLLIDEKIKNGTADKRRIHGSQYFSLIGILPSDTQFVEAAYKISLFNEYIALISVIRSDTITFRMDVFQDSLKILSFPVCKFFGIGLSENAYAYRTSLSAEKDYLIMHRTCYHITDPDYYSLKGKDFYSGTVSELDFSYNLKTKKLSVFKENTFPASLTWKTSSSMLIGIKKNSD